LFDKGGIQKIPSIVHLWHDIKYPKATPIKLRVKDRTSKILEHRRDIYNFNESREKSTRNAQKFCGQ